MSKGFAIGFAITLGLIAIVIWRIADATKGNHLAPVTRVGKVRVQKVDENESIVVLDFSVNNDSDRKLVVRTVESHIDSPDGSAVDGSVIAAHDLDIVFKNYPELGQQYNPAFKAWDEVKPHERIDRMIGVRYDVPDQKISGRRDIDLRLEDISGIVVDLKTK